MSDNATYDDEDPSSSWVVYHLSDIKLDALLCLRSNACNSYKDKRCELGEEDVLIYRKRAKLVKDDIIPNPSIRSKENYLKYDRNVHAGSEQGV